MAKYIFKVTVKSTNEGNKYFIDGIEAPNIILEPGIEYIFDQSDSSNNFHPLLFSEVNDGYHNGGSDLGPLFTNTGVPGSAGAQTEIVINSNVPVNLSYFCSNHSGMGSSLYIDKYNEFNLAIENYSSENGGINLKALDGDLNLPNIFQDPNIEQSYILQSDLSFNWYKNGQKIDNSTDEIEINSDEFSDLFSYTVDFEFAGNNYLITSQNAIRLLDSDNISKNKKILSEDEFAQLIDADTEYVLEDYDHIDLKNNLNVTNTSNIKNINEINELVESISSLEYTEGIIIIKDGEVIAERYYGESSEIDANRIYSVTKSFLSTIYGRAEKLGLISNIDKTLGEIFSDINISEPQASVSIKDLLLMRSGYSDFYAYQNINITSEEETSESYFANVSIEDLLNMPIDEEKGSFFIITVPRQYLAMYFTKKPVFSHLISQTKNYSHI